MCTAEKKQEKNTENNNNNNKNNKYNNKQVNQSNKLKLNEMIIYIQLIIIYINS